MPIYKFKNFSEQRKFEIKNRVEKEFDLERVEALLSWSLKTPFSPGIYKFKNIEEKNKMEMEMRIKNKVEII
ncbi:MAG: hypothetical protein PHX21_06840 [bacterium]|nr:hypothetical protein [bacterium]